MYWSDMNPNFLNKSNPVSDSVQSKISIAYFMILIPSKSIISSV